MRYLGNKETMMSEIIEVLNEKKLFNKNLSFFDAFCGTGSVSDGIKDHFKIIINDNLKWSVIYTKGKLGASNCKIYQIKTLPIELALHLNI